MANTAPSRRDTGATLFFGAIRDLLDHRGAVLRIATLPLVAFLAIEAVSALRFVQWWNSGGLTNGPYELGPTLAFYILVGVLAVAWHRFMILGEQPHGVLPPLRPINLAKYTLGWIVIGIIVGLVTMLCVALPLFVIGSLLDPLFGQWVALGFSYTVLGPEGPLGRARSPCCVLVRP